MTDPDAARIAVAKRICREFGVDEQVAPVLLHLQTEAILAGHTTIETSFAWLEKRGYVEWEVPDVPGEKRTFRVTKAGIAHYRARS